MREEALAQERAASEARENAARQRAEDEARQRAQADRERAQADAQRAQAEAQSAQAEAERLRAEAQRMASERARAQAQLDAERAAQQQQMAEVAKAEADRARMAAEAEQQRLAQQAEEARLAAQRAEQDKLELRRQLTIQLNQILQTRETARGLIVNLSDVLFDTGQYTLKPGAREKLAKVSGIILAHPGLMMDVEGHTDSVGDDAYNMKLSEKRAQAVRDYLVTQGLNSGTITARGFGESQPVADNKTAAGRQQNRRVEMVVSGEILGNQAASDVAR
jgi:outer membrane protein OmpA-like peptidoglycan-associated protein